MHMERKPSEMSTRPRTVLGTWYTRLMAAQGFPQLGSHPRTLLHFASMELEVDRVFQHIRHRREGC
jgi:hypothetical protein